MKSAFLFMMVLAAGLAGTLNAQIRAGDITIMIQATANFADRTYLFSYNGGNETSQYRYREYYLSATPAYWTGDSFAFELEFGYQFSSTERLYEEYGGPYTDNAHMFIPHLIIALGTVDSSLTPYLRGGIGFADNYTTPLVTSFGEELRGDYPALVYSAGAGAFYLIGDHLLLRAELNYRSHRAEGGSNTSLVIKWTAFNFFVGAGLRF